DARDRGNLAGQWCALQQPELDETRTGHSQRDETAGDRGATRAAVGLEDVAVDVNGPLAQRREINHPSQRPPDQALDLDRATVRAAAGHVALLSLAGGGREH